MMGTLTSKNQSYNKDSKYHSKIRLFLCILGLETVSGKFTFRIVYSFHFTGFSPEL